MSRTVAVPSAFDRVRSSLQLVWDRVDRSMLRLQGRVDTPTYDRSLPYGFAILHAALLIVLVLARYHSLQHGVETAKYAQAAWQIGEDLKPVTTLSGGNLMAEQASLIVYPLGLLTSFLPRIETLLIIKSLALALTIIPLWRIARRHGQLGIGATSTIVFAYSLYTYVHNMNIADFAPAVLAVPALMFAVLFGFDEKKRFMTVAIIFALACRADLGLAIAGLGVLLLLERRRRVGTIAVLLGCGWFLVAMYGIQRGLDGDFGFLEPYAAFGDTPLGALAGIISHPVQFLTSVGSEANFTIVVMLLAPVLFLPLTAPRYLMPAVPLYVLYMGADVPVGRVSESAQTVPMTVFVFVATVFALKRTGRILVKRVRVERRILLALILTALVFFILNSSTSPYNQPWDWATRDGVDMARVEAVALIPDELVPVRASSSMLPLLSERLAVYSLDTVRTEDQDLASIIDAATADVDWVLFDRDLETTIVGGDLFAFRVQMAERGWQLRTQIDTENRIDVYEFTGVIASLPEVEEAVVDFGFGSLGDDGEPEG